MMDYYFQNVTFLPDPKEEKAALSGIPDWRCQYILKYLRASDRKLSLGAWRLLEDVLEQHGISAENVTIGANGKPECEGIYFNLSHSADMVMCAISDVPVGCDIEKINDAPLEVAEQFFSEKERRYIAGTETVRERNSRFFQLWTMKESYLKMTGEGMDLSPDRIEIALQTQTILRDSVPQFCILNNFSKDDYQISICLDAF